jgi:predicted nucleic acid-binding protein
MFTHQVALKLRADSAEVFTRKVNKIILPMLRAQEGFCQEITIVAPDRLTAILETHWKTLDNAKNYNRNGYLDVLRVLSEVVVALPRARTFQAAETTFQSINQKAA